MSTSAAGETNLLDFFSAPAAHSAPGSARTSLSGPSTTAVLPPVATASKKRRAHKRTGKTNTAESSSSDSSASDSSSSSEDEAPATRSRHSSLQQRTTAPAAPTSSTNILSPGDGDETFDFASGLALNQAAEAEDREPHFNSPDNDMWGSLQERRNPHGAVQQSTSQQLKLAPDSALYGASKRLDTLSQRMDSAVGSAILSINQFDARTGVSQTLRTKTQPLTNKLDTFSHSATKAADALHASAEEHIRRSSRSQGSKGGRDSRSGSFSGMFGSNQTAAETDMSRAHEAALQSRRSSGARPTLASTAASSSSDDSDGEPNPSPPASAFSSATAATADPAASRSSFSYNPQASAGGNSRSRGSSHSSSQCPPPPLQPSLSFAGLHAPPALHGGQDDPSDVSEPNTPPSTRSSRSNSLTFASLALGDVDLGNSAHSDALSPSPTHKKGLLR